MGKITVIIDNNVEDWLRRKAMRKGDLSKIVNQTLKEKMKRED